MLEPGGKIIIADISHTDEYADWLTEAGMEFGDIAGLGRPWWVDPGCQRALSLRAGQVAERESLAPHRRVVRCCCSLLTG